MGDGWNLFSFVDTEPYAPGFIKTMALICETPKWLSEQRQTPRRMKRQFPRNKPAEHRAYRRACY